MQKRNLFVWQRSTVFLVAAVASSLILAPIWLLNPRLEQAIFQRPSRQMQQKNAQFASDKAPIVLEERGLSKALALLQQEAKAELLNFPLPTQFQGKTLKAVKLSGKEKVIALTFDDGPTPPYTQQILEILKKNNIKATFFLIGLNVKLYPQLAQKVVAEGHVIANHTWSHSYRHFSPEGAAREIEDTAALIYKTTGVKTSIFRPPGGFLHNGVADYAQKKKYFIALWSTDSNDWQPSSPQTLVKNVLRYAKPGGMALMHDGGGPRSHTVQALPKIIAQLKRQGYKFVTVPELLQMGDSQLKAQSAAKLNPKREDRLPKNQIKSST